MDEALRKAMEKADRERSLMQRAFGPSDSIARQIKKLQFLDAVSGTSTAMAAFNEKLKLSEALGGSSVAAAMEKAGLMRDFVDSRLLNERVMAAFGPVLGDSAFAKAIEAVSRPIVDEETLRRLEQAQSSFQMAFKLPDLAAFHKFHEQIMPPAVAEQLDAYAREFQRSLGNISAAIAQKVGLFETFTTSLASLPDHHSFFHWMSGIADTLASFDWQAIEDGEKALDEAGYSFTKERWTLSFFVELANAAPDTRERVADESLLSYTRAEEFTTELFGYTSRSLTCSSVPA